MGELELLVPGVDPVVVGFHEASTAIGIDLQSLGTLLANDNTTRFRARPEIRDGARPYVAPASRGCSAGSTSAIDVVAHRDAPVVAPITGRVTDVRPYARYGIHPDNRVEIRPSQDPSLRVVMVHVEVRPFDAPRPGDPKDESPPWVASR